MGIFDKKIKCNSCGKDIDAESRFCPQCGAIIEHEEVNEDEIKNSSKIILPEYIHPSDEAALKALKAIPGFTPLLKWFMSVWTEESNHIFNMANNIRLSEKQMPKYYSMLEPICEKLQIDVPELYVQLDVNPNSYTWGDTKPYIVITSGLFETVPDELISTVLAHECGHIACHHSLYTQMGAMICSGVLKGTLIGAGLAITRLISTPLQLGFAHWMRCSEFSADRAAMIYDGSSDRMTDVCMRFAGADKDIHDIISKEVFLEQAKDYREMVKESKWDKTLEFLQFAYNDHPIHAVRAYEADEWGKSLEFENLLLKYNNNRGGSHD